jgi:hypothetical protein
MKTPFAATPTGSPAARLAWLLSFAVAVALLALFGLARSAQAMTAPAGPTGPSLSLASSWEEEEGEEAEEEGEEDDLEEAWAECEELEEGEEQRACEEEVEEAEELEELEECTLSEADATVSANPATDTVRLAVRYETYEPGRVTVHPRVRGGKGIFDFGRTTHRFGRSGVYRETTHLSDAKMAKVLAAKQFTVGLQAPGSPDVCDGLFDQQLRRHGGSSPVWR